MRVYPGSQWETDNQWGVPVLEPERCAGVVPYPFEPWGIRAQSIKQPGTWHFYQDDEKFEPLWQKPWKIPETGAMVCCEINFTITWDAPKAIALYQIYRKRWMSRYWQSQGVLMLVDLNVDYKHEELNLLGVPNRWSAFSTRGSWDENVLLHQWAIAQSISGRERPLFVVYAGGQRVEELAIQHGWQYYPTYRGPMVYRGRYVPNG